MKIKKSMSYSTFKVVKGNREINKSHVNKLRTAIEANPQIIEYNPILVNEKMEIIDGQHRFEATKQLNLPIHYIQVEGLGLETVHALNSNQKAWIPKQYAEAFMTQGKKDYGRYLAHRDIYGLNHDIAMQYVGVGNPNTTESFKRGMFRAGNANTVEEFSNRLMELGHYIDHYALRGTALALLIMFQHPEYDHHRMLEKMKQHGSQVERFTKITESLENLARYYNAGLPKEKEVKFS